MFEILEGLIPIGILLTLSIGPMFTVAAIVYHSLRKKELEVRRLEALAELTRAVGQVEVPRLIDEGNGKDLLELEEARKEVELITTHAMSELEPHPV